MMFKNALLSIKKNIFKTLLLFILMIIIANLIIAGISIKEATNKSMNNVKESLGTDVTLSYNMKNMMENRNKGESVDSIMKSITVEMADQLKDLDYVESYNYSLNVNVNSDDIDPVSVSETSNNDKKQDNGPSFASNDNFGISGNTTMEHIENFLNENYTLKSGRLLTSSDANTKNCVIEENLASDNDLKIGSTFKVTSKNSDNEEITVTLKVVGIYTVETSNEMGGMNIQNPMNTIYTSLSTAMKLNNSTKYISSATYYLDSIDHIDSFKSLAKSKTDIDFDNYTLDTTNASYQQNVSSLENIKSFASIFLIIVIVAGSAILALILILTIRSRLYEFGIMLSLGQSKAKIIIQQFIEIGIIVALALCVSLSTGKMVSNAISNMLDTTNNTQVVENKIEQFNKQIATPTNKQLDVSITSTTVIKLVEISTLICILSISVPSIYIMRLSPRELLIKKEG